MNSKPRLAALTLGFVVLLAGTAWSQDPPSEEEAAQWRSDFIASLDLKTGTQSLPDVGATLMLGDSFAFLDADDTARLLEEAWGNPPGQDSHGAIVPQGFDPFADDSWAVIIEYEEDGYVSDEDAAEMDYEALLEEMQADAAASSEERVKAGYGSIELIGWAEPPYYDADSHKVYWAKELAFEAAPSNTLNYNIRALGRRGVLVLNAVGSMDQLSSIRSDMQDLLPMIAFEEGSRYVDFDPDVDTVAAYGIGALVAGKVAAKAGLLAKLAPALLLLKKFGLVAVIAVGALLKRVFGGGKDKHDGSGPNPIV